MKKNVLTVLTLFLIASISGLLLFSFNELTVPIIEKNLQLKVEKVAKEIFPNTNSIKSTIIENYVYVTEEIICYNENDEVEGYLYKSYGVNAFGNIILLVGIKNDKVIQVEFLKLDQSYKDIAEMHTNNVYNKTELSFGEIKDVDVKSGASYSSKLIRDMILECSKVFGEKYEG